MAKAKINKEHDEELYNNFKEFLPYYYAQKDDVPAMIRLRIAINHFPNAAMACHWIVNNITQKRLAKKALRELTVMQVYHEPTISM